MPADRPAGPAGSDDRVLPEHVVHLRRLLEQTAEVERGIPAWLLAQALAALVAGSPDDRPDLAALAAEGLAALDLLGEQGAGLATEDAADVVRSVLDWRGAVGRGERSMARTACDHVVDWLDRGFPAEVRGLTEPVSERLAVGPSSGSGSSAPPSEGASRSWMALIGGQGSGPDAATAAAASRTLLDRAAALPDSDPQRARMLMAGSLVTLSTALGRGMWTAHEDHLFDQVRAAVKALETAGGELGRQDRALYVSVRGARCMAEFMGLVAAAQGARTQELRALCEEADHVLVAGATGRTDVWGPVPEGALSGIAVGIYLLYGQALAAEGAPQEEIEHVLARAEPHLRTLPPDTAARLRLAASMILVRPDDGVTPEALRLMRDAAPFAPDLHLGLGGDQPQVVAQANDALLSGDPVRLAAAAVTVEAFLGDLTPGHPQAAPMQGLLCQVLMARVALTASPEGLVAAVDAGVRGVQGALAARGEADGPTVYTLGPLANALTMASGLDLRSGPFAEAEEAYDQALARPDVGAGTADPQLRLLATMGAGAAGLLRWRTSGDEADRTRGRRRLDEAERLVVAGRVGTMDWVRSAFQVLQLNLSAASLWRDTDAAASALRLLPSLEEVLDQDPALAREATAVLGTGALVRSAGPAGAPFGGDLREALRALHGVLQAMAVGPMFSSPTAGPTVGPAAAPDRDTAEFLLSGVASGARPDMGAMWEQAARSAGMDPQQLRAMMAVVRTNPSLRRQLEAMMGPQAGLIDMMLDLAGGPPPSAPPARASSQQSVTPEPATVVSPDGRDRTRRLSDVERAASVRSATERLRALLPDASAVLSEPLTDRDELTSALDAVTSALADGVPELALRAAARSVSALAHARLAWLDPQRTVREVRAALAAVNAAVALDRGETPALERVHLLDVRARLRRGLRRAEPTWGAEAVEGARVALRELAQVVLARTTPADRLAAAGEAGPIVRRAVSWAVEDGDLEAAVAVVENGRALSLAAVLLNRQLYDLAGAPHDGTRTAAEVLADVSATFDGQVKLLAPSTEQVAMALATTEVDALVYLVPPSRADGHALVLRAAHDGIAPVPLPRAAQRQDLVLDAYRAAYRGFLAAEATGTQARMARRRWERALDDLGSWCHEVVLGPLLRHIDGWSLGRVPHVGLVPVGAWAALPFAAAWRPDPTLPGGRRYAVHDVVLTTVPSGRAFLRAAAATAVPVDADVLVVIDPHDPAVHGGAGQSLAFARAFGRTVTSVFPQATVVQRSSGSGTAERVLEALPSPTAGGASLLHLTTHGRLDPDVAIKVADGWLPLARILDQARDIGPGRPGGIVVVNACVTDVMDDSLDVALDESLTLATGMLAAGARHVVATRWPVPDGGGAVLSYRLLRHLARGLAPAHALRAAQLDLLEGTGGPGALGKVPADELAAPWAWAGYTHQGV